MSTLTLTLSHPAYATRLRFQLRRGFGFGEASKGEGIVHHGIASPCGLAMTIAGAQ